MILRADENLADVQREGAAKFTKLFPMPSSMKHLLNSILCLAASGALAGTANPSAPAGVHSMVEGETLTGDWFGVGSVMRDRGISLTGSLTNFYQGLASGEGTHSWQYGAKGDLFLRADGAKLGLWTGFGIHSHLELNFGQSLFPAGGVSLPNNIGLTFPGANETLLDLSLYGSQRFGDSVTVMFGKINAVDLYAAGREFSGGRGVDLFQHLEFTAPISGITPPMFFGGIVSVKTEPAKLTLMIYDPVTATMHSGFCDPFAQGVTVNASVEIESKFFGRSGKHVFSGAYGTQDGTSLSDPYLLLPTTPPPARTEDRWYFAYAFEQTLWRDAGDPTKASGLFGQISVSDGNPNPVEWSLVGGFSGNSPIPGRGRDRLGVAAFYVGYADGLKEGLHLAGLPTRDEAGAEVFYTVAFTPWLHVTADLQVVRPTLSDRDTAVIAGMRAKIVF